MGLDKPRTLLAPFPILIDGNYVIWHRRGTHYSKCGCPGIHAASGFGFRRSIIDTNLAYTSKFFAFEVLPCLYSKKTFYFPCTCAILYHIKTNHILCEYLSRIKFIWAGFISDQAIIELRRVPLTHLTVIIGTFTTKFVTHQETLFRRFFKRKTTHITQALGIFELIELRGIEFVRVENYGDPLCRPSEGDRKALERMLIEHVGRERVDQSERSSDNLMAMD
ncbi:hypothetical protein F5Y00DRAFT_270918 [Daldinia vernicosa]|uniref:uncharacterized protein n=1 Tax=Daldinia vernicosa TaxID=114800 RepID=UPI0020075AE5|nr:uncharacterized protein F5Y00DRAFT_270918 [Daldinia vernicosa]KAI0847780.1 hypothetical protein F5Y00DRAFT_270918 [Daldinia vernicosa]